VAIVVALAWLAVGGYSVTAALRHRAYVNSLPPSVRRIRQQNNGFLILGVGAVVCERPLGELGIDRQAQPQCSP